MELRTLRYFLIVAREENITHAAELLHISQPTLSRQLMQLEDELGVKLLQRGKYNVYLTGEGVLFRRRAQEIVNLADRAMEEMKQEDELLTGTISIGCGELRSMAELAEIIVAFQSQYPLVHFDIHSAYNVDIKDRLEQGLLDLGLLVEPVEISKYDFVRMRTKERWGVLVREDSDIAEHSDVHPKDLAQLPLMASRNELSWNEMESWFGKSGEKPAISTTYNLLYNAAIILREKGGAALCLDQEAHYDGLKFVPLSPPLEFFPSSRGKSSRHTQKRQRRLFGFSRNTKNELLSMQTKHFTFANWPAIL